MKRYMLVTLALVALVAPLAWADEETEVYRQIYLQADSLGQKYAAAVGLLELKDPSVAPVLSDALADLMRTQNNYLGSSDKETFALVVRLLAGALGEYKYVDAAPSLWSVVNQVGDPLARADALMALGKMRALDYVEKIALMLRNFDIAPGPNSEGDEKVAFGCIIALEKMRDARGFMPVFYATTMGDAWYSQRVRQQAERSLPNITADPTDPIMELIRNETVTRKIVALKQSALSQAPAARKVQTAVLALDVGHAALARDKTEAKDLSDLRKQALRTLVALKAPGDDAVPLAVKSYTDGYDDEEKLLALQLLGANGGDAAATALRDIILQLDREQRAGVTSETRNRLAKAAVENAGIAKNKILRMALLSVASNDKWSGGIILAAQTALKAMP